MYPLNTQLYLTLMKIENHLQLSHGFIRIKSIYHYQPAVKMFEVIV